MDAAIDRAARDVMNVDADSTFRARVFARLERPAARRFGWPTFGIVGSAAAAAVFAFNVLQSPEPATPLPAASERPAAAARSDAGPAPPATVVEAPAERLRPVGRSTTRPTTRPVLTAPNVTQDFVPGTLAAASVDDDAAEIRGDAAGSFEPIVMQPIGSRPLAPSAIVIAPLAPITELQIAPLPPRIERD
jgi:hypothetical protein